MKKDVMHPEAGYKSFHNMLRSLTSLDGWELDDVLEENEWQTFRDNPWSWSIKADSRRGKIVYDRIMARQ